MNVNIAIFIMNLPQNARIITCSKDQSVFGLVLRRCLVLKEAVRVLDDPRVVEDRPDLKAQITWDLLPFLVVTGAEAECVGLQLASCVAGTTLICQHPLTKGWAKGKC